MFSSDALIQIAFANQSDEFFCGDMLKLDLNQYLWLKLHEKYETVYFVNSDDEGQLIANSFGDIGSEIFCYESRGLFGVNMSLGRSKAERFGKWFCEKLTSNKQTAFVFNLSNFCGIFEKDIWRKTIEKIKRKDSVKGTIVLIVPPYVERSRELLLNSPVFGYFGERGITELKNGEIRNIYSALKSNMGESCVFLNDYSAEKMHDLLIHVSIMSDKGLYSEEKLRVMSDYLSRYLNCRDLQLVHRLFPKHFNSVNPKYTELYDCLVNERVWGRLSETADRIISKGGIRQFLSDEHKCVKYGYNPANIFYERGSIAWKCMSITPFDNTPPDSDVFSTILEIYREFSMPRNVQENEVISNVLKKFVTALENSNNLNDEKTYKRTLYSIYICTQWIYAGKDMNSELKKVSDILYQYINMSTKKFRTEKNMNSIVISEFSAADAVSSQMQKQNKTLEIYLNKMDKWIPTYIARSIGTGSEGIGDIHETVRSFFEELDSVLDNSSSEEPSENFAKPLNDFSEQPDALIEGLRNDGHNLRQESAEQIQQKIDDDSIFENMDIMSLMNTKVTKN